MRGTAGVLKLAAAVLLFVAAAASARADVKIKAKQGMAGQSSEQTIYIKGKRQRTEMMGGQMISVQQCDLRRDLQINAASKTYTVTSYAQDSVAAQKPSAARAQAQTPQERGGVVTTTVTNKDTGERKQMFGHTARRIITTMVTESSPDACTPMKTRMEIDGWYIDAAFAPDCDAARNYQYSMGANASGCRDRYESKQVGAVRTGFPVLTKTTMSTGEGAATYEMTYEVTEISQATLDAALFDAPAGYREVKTAAELYGASGADAEGEDESDADETSEPALASSYNNSTGGRGASSSRASTLKAKREGVVRLGVVAVRTGAVGDGMSASELASAVRDSLTAQLAGPGVEVVGIESRMPADVEAEAGEKDCDFVVYASVSHKKGGGIGFGRLLGGAARAVGVAPVSGTSATAAYVASSGYAAASTSAGVKSRDELTLDIRLESPGGAAPTVTRQFKTKARSNGDDIVTPAAEQAAQAIMDAAASSN
ncbi:MAG TPA: hypothetical protein VFX96_07720 [Pyrinomonadaceae bacterium]|nr:hypothetical protein [Pyrinomonadaceae bacterium]